MKRKRKKGQVRAAPLSSGELPDEYATLLAELKEQIRSSKSKATLSVNRELVLLYWRIGRRILDRQETEGWGAKVIDRLSADLRKAFPNTKGFSPRNLKYMRAFAGAYRRESIVQQAAALVPWFHNCILLDRVKDPKERLWYTEQAIANAWSRNVLAHQIQTGLYQRSGKAVTNFPETLQGVDSGATGALLKDPYFFDFLSLGEKASERQIEKGLLEHVRRFLLELGVGFAFVGSQVHLEVGGEDFYLDLLFYHYRLRCFVAVDLKAGKFKPEYSGKMNFYLSAVDDLFRQEGDGPSVGVVLCKTRNRVVAEYALRDLDKPLGISTYVLGRALPDSVSGTLPTVEELEEELGDDT